MARSLNKSSWARTFLNFKTSIMETLKKYRENRKTRSFFILILGLLTLSACHKEYIIIDGAPGRAYLALIWTEIEPDYIDPGTFAIPDIFYWDEYYRIAPGFYTMYYDGAYYDRGDFIEYAWEIDYEVFENPGELGGINYIGRNGEDNYFTLECNPYGPWMYHDFKSASIDSNSSIKELSSDKIIIEKQQENFTIKITYKKVIKRDRTQQKSNK